MFEYVLLCCQQQGLIVNNRQAHMGVSPMIRNTGRASRAFLSFDYVVFCFVFGVGAQFHKKYDHPYDAPAWANAIGVGLKLR